MYCSIQRPYKIPRSCSIYIQYSYKFRQRLIWESGNLGIWESGVINLILLFYVYRSPNFSLVQTELNEVFRQNYEATLPPSYATAMTAEIFKVTDTTHAAYIGTVHKGPGLFSKIGEVQAIPSYVAKVANKWTVTIADFAEGISVSKDLFDDDIHGEWMSQVTEFAIMARRTQDYNAFKIFRGAFTTTLSADGAALIGAHTLLGGGTTNKQIVAADVGAATSVLTTSAY